MKARGAGKIVNLSSQAGRSKSEVSNLPYASAKAGVLGFTRNLAFEVGPFGITVNAVAPGVTLTGRVQDKLSLRSDRDELTSAVPLRRFGMPEEIASTILFLASREADYITGATIDVNGGRTMM
jgi:3-oxoacyl-[acyl-carrier protein] reductase